MNRVTDLSELSFFATPEHPCNYLPGRQATTLFADPRVSLDVSVYTALAKHGFRRSGSHIYRPHCAQCRACVSVRVPVAEFEPRRADRRCLRANADLTMEARKPSFSEEQFALYTRYLRQRHAGGGMDEPEEHQYLDFLTAAWCDTRFLEFRLDSRLVAVAVTDVLDDALSAVYTFFDPDLAGRGLGRYAVLRQIERARTEGRRWLYLGYWIAESPKMAYKGQYRPLERYTEGAWRRLPV